jgi:DNA recombination protein RmuC
MVRFMVLVCGLECPFGRGFDFGDHGEDLGAGGHAAAVGRALDTAVGKYNQFVGSLESQVMVSARRFEDLQVDHEGKDLGELTPIESAPRALSRPELTVGEAPPAALPGA